MSTTAHVADVPKCACSTLRKATRSVARIYDGRLARAGLTTTQFSILRALERHGRPVGLSRLAEELVMERTSLYRALEPLGRARLVAFTGSADKRAKEVTLTRWGEKKIAAALPHWREAQEEFLAQFGRSAWSTLATQLGAIVQAAQAIPTAD